MSAVGKILLGIATVFPFVLLALYVLSFFPVIMMANVEETGTEPVVGIFSIGISMILLILLVISTMALFIYYLIHVINNPRLDAQNRLIWAIVILFFSNLGYLVYWYFQIWREEDDRVEHHYQN